MAPVNGTAHNEGESGDTELFSEVLRAQTKSFFLDLKENARGKYLKVAEKGRYRPKSSIVVPISGLPQVLRVVKYFIDESNMGRIGQPRDVIVESKVFSFSSGSNERGQYLRIFESGGGYPTGGSSLMIPAGFSNTYLKMFLESLERIARHVSQDGTLGFDLEQAINGTMPLTPGYGPSGPDAVVLDSKEGGPVLSVGSKHFFFELRANERGHYLKVKEVSGNMKNLLVIPAHAIGKFQEAMAMAINQRPRQDSGGAPHQNQNHHLAAPAGVQQMGVASGLPNTLHGAMQGR